MPFCGLAVIQELTGIKMTHVQDPYLKEVSSWAYQELQDHQKSVVDRACVIHGLSADTVHLEASAATTEDVAADIRTLFKILKLSPSHQQAVLKSLLNISENS